MKIQEDYVCNFFLEHPSEGEKLLYDQTTGKNIVDDNWKTPLTADKSSVIVPRCIRNSIENNNKQKNKGEVYTPDGIINFMLNDIDERMLKTNGVFNDAVTDENGYAKTWNSIHNKFDIGEKNAEWYTYVALTYIEITCGEGAFITRRYNQIDGEEIEPSDRFGFLDRKLEIIRRNRTSETAQEELIWLTLHALAATYGYEYSGKSLLIARINVYLTATEFLQSNGIELTNGIKDAICQIITQNIIQMDGITMLAPNGEYARFFDYWRDKPIKFSSIPDDKDPESLFFYVSVGNPPYQLEKQRGGNKMKSIYNVFIDQAFACSYISSIICPARFLSNAGSTPKKWNKKILYDRRIRIALYAFDNYKVFENTDIKGGICVLYKNNDDDYGGIEKRITDDFVFVFHPQIMRQRILLKVFTMGQLTEEDLERALPILRSAYNDCIFLGNR